MNIGETVTKILQEIAPMHCFEEVIDFEGHTLKLGHEGDHIDLDEADKISVLAIGKAASAQAEALLRRLRKLHLLRRVNKVAILTKVGHLEKLSDSSLDVLELEGDHPVSGQKSFQATLKLIEWLGSLAERDVLMICISGGASAILELKRDNIPWPVFEKLQKGLLYSGFPIERINIIRQEISMIKNGKLLEYCPTRDVVNFVFSDLPSGGMHLVGSGPTIFRRPLDEEVDRGKSDLKKIGFGDIKWQNDFPPEGEKTVINIKVMDYKGLCQRIKSIFPEVTFLGKALDCSLEVAIDIHLDWIKKNISGGLLMSGGEAPIVVEREGKGGRNTHFVALLGKKLFKDNILALDKSVLKKITLLSMGTDGQDGDTDAAGAWLSYETFMKNENIEPAISNFDSYFYFEQINGLIKTGNTGTNIMDLRLIEIAK